MGQQNSHTRSLCDDCKKVNDETVGRCFICHRFTCLECTKKNHNSNENKTKETNPITRCFYCQCVPHCGRSRCKSAVDKISDIIDFQPVQLMKVVRDKYSGNTGSASIIGATLCINCKNDFYRLTNCNHWVSNEWQVLTCDGCSNSLCPCCSKIISCVDPDCKDSRILLFCDTCFSKKDDKNLTNDGSKDRIVSLIQSRSVLSEDSKTYCRSCGLFTPCVTCQRIGKQRKMAKCSHCSSFVCTDSYKCGTSVSPISFLCRVCLFQHSDFRWDSTRQFWTNCSTNEYQTCVRRKDRCVLCMEFRNVKTFEIHCDGKDCRSKRKLLLCEKHNALSIDKTIRSVQSKICVTCDKHYCFHPTHFLYCQMCFSRSESCVECSNSAIEISQCGFVLGERQLCLPCIDRTFSSAIKTTLVFIPHSLLLIIAEYASVFPLTTSTNKKKSLLIM